MAETCSQETANAQIVCRRLLLSSSVLQAIVHVSAARAAANVNQMSVSVLLGLLN